MQTYTLVGLKVVLERMLKHAMSCYKKHLGKNIEK